ncbi:MAG UNVERIFIED_CONTAM: hypothetical protein LVR18_42845 [Planctomycetaceae bacterium]
MTSTGDQSTVTINAAAVEIIGGITAGAQYRNDGTLNWTGTDADVSVVADRIAIGGLGVSEFGTIVTRGGSVQATGDVVFRTPGTAADSGFSLNSMSFIRTMTVGTESLPAISETPSVSVLSDSRVSVLGLIEAAGSLADLLIDASGSVRLDGILRADDQMTISSRAAGDDAIELAQLMLWSNSAGQLLNQSGRAIDRSGYLIDAQGRHVDASGNLLPTGAAPVAGEHRYV